MDSKNLSAKRTPAHAQMTLCNKMDDSLEMEPPQLGWGGLFPNYKRSSLQNVQLISILFFLDYLLTVL